MRHPKTTESMLWPHLSDLVLGSLGIVRNVPQKGRLTEEAERDFTIKTVAQIVILRRLIRCRQRK
jgi:hypothetical protein